MELRQLEAFVAVADELHFGRAAARLHMGQPTLSESIRRLERELGTPLFERTTRSVALTSAGKELLARTTVILDDLAATVAAVRRVADGDAGTVRIGITPPVAPVLIPHLRAGATQALPDVTLEIRQLWLPALTEAAANASIDVAITVGLIPGASGVVNEVFCAEPLLVGLRARHRLAGRDAVVLSDLDDEVLGAPDSDLFPAWALAQKQALDVACISPPTIQLEASDLSASEWTRQSDIDWILLTSSLTTPHHDTVIRPVTPAQVVPYTLQWSPQRAQTAAVARFVHFVLSSPPPRGWVTQSAHRGHASS